VRVYFEYTLAKNLQAADYDKFASLLTRDNNTCAPPWLYSPKLTVLQRREIGTYLYFLWD